MLAILALTIPIYVAIAAGYITTRMGLFSRADMRVLGTFVVNIALPCLLFLAVGSRDIGEILNPTYAGAYAIGSLLTFTIAWAYARRVERAPTTGAAFYGMAMTCPNSGFIGYPVLLLALPSVAGVVLGLNMLVENLVTIPLVLALAERGAGSKEGWWQEVRETFARLIRNPMVVGILLGLVVSILGVSLPAVLTRAVDLFSRAATAVALFAVGGLLVGLPLRGMGRQLSAVTLGKLVLHPAAVAGVLWVLVRLGLPQLSAQMQAALVLSAAMPVFTVYPVLAQKYGQERVASAGLLASTATSFITLSALLFALRGITGTG